MSNEGDSKFSSHSPPLGFGLIHPWCFWVFWVRFKGSFHSSKTQLFGRLGLEMLQEVPFSKSGIIQSAYHHENRHLKKDSLQNPSFSGGGSNISQSA